ncbi:MAG TPA: hypothetical protein VH207_14930 [Chthoniobacterales bacterium]|jgi:hypothetical protein|nr:hypothetical protein [Chthoniobacterales bacterium]
MSETEIETIERKIIFACGERGVTVRDLLDAALFRGELGPAWKELLRLVAAERKADEQELQYSDDAIDAAAERFRYEHDLITAEETEQWLADRGLSLGDFGAYFVRHYWGEQFQDAPAEPLDLLTAPNEVRDLLTTELILSGELERMAQRLSWRLAASCATLNERIAPELIAEEKARFLERSGLREDEVAGWLEKIGRDEEWWRECLKMEAIHHRDCAALLSREAREREIAALRLPLTRFEVETIELDSLDAAREALLCARDDGMSMEEVAAEGRYPYRHPEVLLEEIPVDLQQKFLSVHPGEILEPIARGDGFHVCRVVGKAEPDLEDPVVKTRAEERILDRHFADLTTRHIQWRLLLA